MMKIAAMMFLVVSIMLAINLGIAALGFRSGFPYYFLSRWASVWGS